MPLQRGEDINIGIAREAARGTFAEPVIFVPGRTPTGIKAIVEKAEIAETRSTKMQSHGAEIVKKENGGQLEFNLRSRSIGYFLLSLLGKVTSAAKSGETLAYEHLFEVLPVDPQHPSLSIALSRPGNQSYAYSLGMAKMLEIRTPINDLINGTVDLLAATEAEHADFTPVFPSTDTHFRHQDLSFKLATTMAGLDAAGTIKLNDFSISIDNGGRGNQHIGNLENDDMLMTVLVIEGEMEIDFTDKTYYDLFKTGAYRALRITAERPDITIGTAAHPGVVIDLPKISFMYDEDRPMDDIVTQKISFSAHYSLSDALGIKAKLTNDKANYVS